MTSMEERPPGSGRWRPPVPLPHYGVMWMRCQCGKRFWPLAGARKNQRAYRRYKAHYQAEHAAGTEVIS